jgi:hypothetical protein
MFLKQNRYFQLFLEDMTPFSNQVFPINDVIKQAGMIPENALISLRRRKYFSVIHLTNFNVESTKVEKNDVFS